VSDYKVLVVDDDEAVLALLAEHLARRHVACRTAGDGRTAAQILKESGGQYGLVFTDITMPGADGFEVLAAARAANATAYVAMMTGMASPEVRARALASGADTFLEKPFSLDRLDVILTEAKARGLSILPQ